MTNGPNGQQSGVDGEALRRVMRRVASPVTVVTAAGSDGPRGITIGSFTSVSLDPPLISFNLDKAAQMHALLDDGIDRLAIHLLSDEQAHLSNHFAVPDLSSDAQFADINHHLNEDGTPILASAIAVLHCDVYATYPAGDHTIVVGAVRQVAYAAEAGKPLLYFDRRYCSVGEEVTLSLFSPVNRASSDAP